MNVVSAVCNQAALFFATAVVARYLGKVSLGEYALGLAVLSIGGIFAIFGFQMTLTRYVAIHLADRDVARLRGTIRFGICTSAGISICLAGAIAVAAPWLAAVFGRPEFAGDLRLVAVALPAGAIRDGCLAAVRGWQTQRAFALITWVWEPLARLTLTIVVLAFGYGTHGAFVAIAVAAWSAAGLAAVALRRRLRTVRRSTMIVEARPLLNFSVMSLSTGLASVGLVWADLIILGAMDGAASAGVYNVSTRLVNLAIFVMLPMNAAFAPQFAHLIHVKDSLALQRSYRAATTWILRLSLPAFAVLLVFPDQLLRVFGPQYVVGASVTVILTVGQLINAATGPSGGLLNMSSRVRVNMINNILVLAFNIALNIVLIPPYGIVGAALAWSISLAAVNIARIIEVKVLLRVMPFGWPTLKSAVAAAGAVAGCAVGRVVGSSPIGELVIGVVLAAVAYVALQIAVGLEPDERALISNIRSRR